jgi:chemosensory pili system protein ChpA (sensor histidine kinase/response regulator)
VRRKNFRHADATVNMKTILFVEDDPVIVQVYRSPLEKAGFRVEVAGDGLEAMKNLLQLRPDLVLLDVMMPKVDGTYVLKFIRSRSELAHTRVIVLSSATKADIARDVLAQNPDGVFLKSQCTPKELIRTVEEMTGQKAVPSA